MRTTADDLIAGLGLEPHLEGGYFKEIYRNEHHINPGEPLACCAVERCVSTTIYYLLKSGQVSKFHKLSSDEIWFYHAGSPLNIYMIDKQGVLTIAKLGLAVHEGELPQVAVPANTIFGADVAENDSFTLVSCMVSPGFEYQDFTLYTSEELIKRYPKHNGIITKLNG